MPNKIEVTITIGDRKLTLEGPEDFVRSEVERFANSELAGGLEGRDATAEEGAVILGPRSPSERQLIAEKKPQNHVETVAVLAYCLTKNGQEEFTPEDIRRAYLRAHVRPPKVIAQALRDAKNTSDYIQPGRRRGTFRLSPHGERTVMFDMPRSEPAHT